MAPSDQHRLLVDKQIHNHRHDVRIGYAQISTALTQKKQAVGARFRKQDDADARIAGHASELIRDGADRARVELGAARVLALRIERAWIKFSKHHGLENLEAAHA